MPETNIHPTAIVDPRAELDPSVVVGPYAIIEGDVEIAAGCKIGPRVLIAEGARLEENVVVHHAATIGTIPQDLKFGGEKTILKVGAGTVIREYVTMNRGTDWSGHTLVGKNCFFMAYAHVPHDAVVGDNVIAANSVQMGGHVVVGDYAILGGGTVIHQFTKIGGHVIIGGGLRITQDIVPYAVIGGYPLEVGGVNIIGLKRRGYKLDRIKPLKEAFRFLFKSDLNTSQAVEKIKAELEQTDEIKNLLDFIENSERGLIK
ncbi:MAG: acyl-ACP--UDP-N-acetylglucosamine O-acyltransferase [candidate division Zixibacteria bacterium]|nr:acyl-ACP--UDP-N-acetylglucosamine O-acyltransferase [candidate division Zixibacteria bacterium]